MWRLNELLNWQVASSGDDISMADAAATKILATEWIQKLGRLSEGVVGRYGDPADANTAETLEWLDAQTKRHLVITFGGGVNEVMRGASRNRRTSRHGAGMDHGRAVRRALRG
ncbi:putative acyl-CoA dehydrogenase [Mycobacteroides abscessus subsp. abscessus]|nr:putative acyl-CoA dehydrogenase [Mycobacteroides abscessus subsp. abscessus]